MEYSGNGASRTYSCRIALTKLRPYVNQSFPGYSEISPEIYLIAHFRHMKDKFYRHHILVSIFLSCRCNWIRIQIQDINVALLIKVLNDTLHIHTLQKIYEASQEKTASLFCWVALMIVQP